MPRIGARVLLVDPAGRVLLIHEFYGGDGQTHWLTPGGGVEPGETLHQAAAREVFEETGHVVRLDDSLPAVHETRRFWSGGGVQYDQVDHFFLATVSEAFTAIPASPTPEELASAIGSRWWTVEELQESQEVLLPPDISDVLARLMPPEHAARHSY